MISPATRRQVIDLALERVTPREIARRMNVDLDDVYAVIKKARAEGADIPSFQGTKKAEAEAELAKLRRDHGAAIVAVSLALPLLRAQARDLIECCWSMDRRPDAPIAGTAEPDDVEAVDSYLAAIRAAEAVTSRPDDDLPKWFNEVIDGRMAL